MGGMRFQRKLIDSCTWGLKPMSLAHAQTLSSLNIVFTCRFRCMLGEVRLCGEILYYLLGSGWSQGRIGRKIISSIMALMGVTKGSGRKSSKNIYLLESFMRFKRHGSEACLKDS